MIVLLTGGSACGKSSFAESLVMGLPTPRYYLATMRPYGAEDQERIARHLALREGKDFITIERYDDLFDLQLPERGGTVLLECLCNLTSNEMFDPATWEERDPVAAVVQGVESLAEQCDNLIVVTNDVGSDIQVDYSEQTKDYIRFLGTVNCLVAAMADTVVETVAGVSRVVKGALPGEPAADGLPVEAVADCREDGEGSRA